MSARISGFGKVLELSVAWDAAPKTFYHEGNEDHRLLALEIQDG